MTREQLRELSTAFDDYLAATTLRDKVLRAKNDGRTAKIMVQQGIGGNIEIPFPMHDVLHICGKRVDDAAQKIISLGGAVPEK